MKFLKANWNDRHRTLPSDRRFDLRIDVWGAIRSIRTGFFVDLIETAAVQLEVMKVDACAALHSPARQ
jgi:hypothetical protein